MVREIALLFLKLGTIAFGGPAAHIAMMEDEVVRRRRWLTREEFLDHVGATTLIPGPNSTELALQIGYTRAGWAGLVTAGFSFIVPASLIVWGLSWAYVRYGTLPQTAALLYGVKPVMIAIVLQALWSLGRTAVKSRVLAGLGLVTLAAAAAGVHELLVLGAAACGIAAVRGWKTRSTAVSVVGASTALSSGTLVAAAQGTAAVATIALLPLFFVFLKAGAFLFGSGYVLLAFLRADLVERLGWLTEAQLLDAIAVGQVTPGPVFTTATFIGYVLHGTPGAIVATVAIFLPAFVYVAVSGPLLPRLRRSPVAAAALDGVNVASLALMALVAFQLARAAIIDAPTLVIAAASAVALMRYRLNAAILVAAGAAIGLILSSLR